MRTICWTGNNMLNNMLWFINVTEQSCRRGCCLGILRRVTLKWAQEATSSHGDGMGSTNSPPGRKEESLILPSSGSSGAMGQTWHGNTNLLHLPLEMNHLLKGKVKKKIQGLLCNIRQIWCPWETGTMKQTLIQRNGSAVMWVDMKILRNEKQTFQKSIFLFHWKRIVSWGEKVSFWKLLFGNVVAGVQCRWCSTSKGCSTCLQGIVTESLGRSQLLLSCFPVACLTPPPSCRSSTHRI